MSTFPQRFDDGTPLAVNGEDVPGSLSLKKMPGTTITLQPDKEYRGLEYGGHCRIGALFQVIYNDDGDEEIIYQFGPEALNSSPGQEKKKFLLNTSGKSGTQELFIKYKNFQIESTVRGDLATTEFD